MKRMVKSALALMLCAVMLLSLPAVAADKTGTKTFYDQLDGYAQGIYNAFCRSDVQGWLRTGEKFTLTFDGPFSDAQAAANAIAQAETWALAAFELDYPDFFWLRGSDVNVSGNSDKLTMTVTTNFWNNWANGSRSVFDDEAAVTAAVRRIAGEARAQGGTYEQLLYIHDWLTLNNQYNLAATESKDKESNRVPYTPVSARLCPGIQAALRRAGYPLPLRHRLRLDRQCLGPAHLEPGASGGTVVRRGRHL